MNFSPILCIYFCVYFADFMYWVGVAPVYCLKIRLNVDFELKPVSNRISRTVF